jgi:hypothetical protein
MYSSGSLSSSVLKSDALQNGANPCSESYMTAYAKIYPEDKARILERQRFIGRDCGAGVVEAKKSYCDAYAKQLETYTALVKKYETCLKDVPAPVSTKEVTQ